MENKVWQLFPQNKLLANEISQKVGISSLLSQILINRGINTPQEAKKFIYDDFSCLPSPNAFEEIQLAVDIITKALINRKKILIFGDYDTDGVTATVILFSTLKLLGADVIFSVPNRFKSYGLTKDKILIAKKHSISLIITVDCGIKSEEEVLLANKLGCEVIITDHHLPDKSLPPASSIINPHCSDLKLYHNLSGVGISFLLSWALLKKYNREEEVMKYLDLVCLGTVGDVVPLLDANRILVKEGLKYFRRSPRLGIKALMEVSGIKEVEEITSSYHLSYLLVPRLNSAGRMWHAKFGVDLLLTQDEVRAKEIASLLQSKNSERQNTQGKILEEALNIIEVDNLLQEKIIIIHKENWHPGIIGIVASQLCEKFNRPAILFSTTQTSFGCPDKNILKGSGRSTEIFNLSDNLDQCSDLLLSGGGHKKAAGLSLHRENLDKFIQRMQDSARNLIPDGDLISKITPDIKISLLEVDDKIMEEINLLSPYGEGNEEPLFLAENVQPLDITSVTEGKHLKMKLKQDNKILEAIWFNAKNKVQDINTNLDIVFSPQWNVWGQRERNIQLKIKEVRKNEKVF